MEENEVLKKFSKWLDDKIDFKRLVGGIPGAIMEMADGPVFSIAFNTAYDKVPEEYREDVLRVLESVMSGNYQGLSREAIDIAVERIKTPLGDAKEKIILGGITDIVFNLIEEESNVAA